MRGTMGAGDGVSEDEGGEGVERLLLTRAVNDAAARVVPGDGPSEGGEGRSGEREATGGGEGKEGDLMGLKRAVSTEGEKGEGGEKSGGDREEEERTGGEGEECCDSSSASSILPLLICF